MLSLMAHAVTVILALQGTSDASAQTFYEEFQLKRDAITTLRADFTQTTTTPEETLISTGTILYTNPKRISFRYDDAEMHFLIHNGRAYEYDGELQQLQIFDMEDRPETEAFYLGFEGNAERLTEAYTVRVLKPEPGESGVDIELRPKDSESDSVFFEVVRLHLRSEDLLPTSIHIINDAESEVVYAIENFTLNDLTVIDENRIFLPEGTLIIENDAYRETVGPEGMYVPPATPVAESENTEARE